MTADSSKNLALSQLDFGNTAIAFHNVETGKLRQSYRVFQLFQQPWLVRMAPWIADFTVRTGIPIGNLLSKSAFRHFCGGESIEQCLPYVQELGAAGVGSILDYATERLHKESDFEKTTAETLRNIEFAAQNPHIPFCVFKPTGIARFELLEKISAGFPLTKEENDEWQRVRGRLDRICQKASTKGIRVFVDAEETWIQDAVDTLTEEFMKIYNKERPIVFNTVQMYRHDRIAYLNQLFDKARNHGFHIGLKIVRGAYMEKERARAFKLGYPSPIHPNKESTDKAYDESLRLCIENRSFVAICAGTHNEKSTLLLTQLVENARLPRNTSQASFAQLLGMGDNLTFNLTYFGFQAAKYMPYGKLKDLLPYLARRAQENSSLQGQSGRELTLIRKELERRRRQPELSEGSGPKPLRMTT